MTNPPKLTPTRAIPRQGTSRTAWIAEPPAPGDPLLDFSPYLHKQPRRNSITPDRQREFIATLAATGIVSQAARRIGASLEALYKLRQRPGAEGFAAAWDAAIDHGIARLEDCALERALKGEERPVVSAGRLVTTYTRYDTQLVLFLLRQRRAHRYGSPVERAAHRAADEYDPDEAIAQIDADLDRMRAHWLAARESDAGPDSDAGDWPTRLSMPLGTGCLSHRDWASGTIGEAAMSPEGRTNIESLRAPERTDDVARELGRLLDALSSSFPFATDIRFEFDGTLRVYIDVPKAENVVEIEARLPAIGGGVFSEPMRGATPGRAFLHRVTARVNV